jgi:hypothetical protein
MQTLQKILLAAIVMLGGVGLVGKGPALIFSNLQRQDIASFQVSSSKQPANRALLYSGGNGSALSTF